MFSRWGKKRTIEAKTPGRRRANWIRLMGMGKNTILGKVSIGGMDGS